MAKKSSGMPSQSPEIRYPAPNEQPAGSIAGSMKGKASPLPSDPATGSEFYGQITPSGPEKSSVNKLPNPGGDYADQSKRTKITMGERP